MILTLNNSANYFKLMRIHTLTGAWLLLLPALWGLFMFSQNFYQLFWIPVFIVGALSMRSAGCIINDIIDINIDAKVERTKNRPLVISLVSKSEAMLLFIILLFIAFTMLCIIAIYGGKIAIITALIMLIIVCIYPFAKRFTKYPQVVLATAFSAGDLFASIAINGEITLASVMLYIGSGFWVIYYDILYAHQDKIYDQKIGVGSMALTKFGTKRWLSIFYKFSIIFWIIAGSLSKLNILFYCGMLFVYIVLHKQVKNINLHNTEECMDAFRFNEKVGIIMLIAIMIGKM